MVNWIYILVQVHGEANTMPPSNLFEQEKITLAGLRYPSRQARQKKR